MSSNGTGARPNVETQSQAAQHQATQPLRSVPPAEAQQKLAAWQTGRGALPGINNRPLPQNGQLKQTASGRYVLDTPDGRNFALNNRGLIVSYAHDKTRAAIDENGRLQAVRTPDMLVRRGVTGERRVESVGSDHSYAVSYGPKRGFVERPVAAGNSTLVERTSIDGSSVTVTHYQDFSYQGGVLESYVPDTVYAPTFYTWLGTPWAQPVAYQWGWAGSPWTAQYHSYFQPETAYSSPTMLMTDQFIADNLASAYSASQSADVDDPPPPSTFEDLPRVAASETTPISHDLKVGVSEQLGRVLARDGALAQSSGAALVPAVNYNVPAALDPEIHFYFVDDAMDVKTRRGDGHCSLRTGTALEMSEPPAGESREADLVVKSGLTGDCPAETHVLIAVRDLQAMQNHCHESLRVTAATFDSSGSRKGLPPAPPSGAHPAIPSLPSVDLAAKGKEAGATLAQQQADSVKLEADTRQDLQASLR